MDNIANSIRLTPAVKASGLMIEKDGEIKVTDAGLFAMAGMMAYDPDNEARMHCMSGFLHALRVARAGGLDEQAETVILWAFTENLVPGDGSPEGTALASLCRLISTLVGVGRMGQLMEGKKGH